MSSVIKSISDNQDEILTSIRDLHCGGKFDCDCTYGNGVFYKTIPRPTLCFDIEPLHPFVQKADSRSLPLADKSINSLVFDPPFLTYVRANRTGNGNMIMAKRFAGYWSWDDLTGHYVDTMKEANRVIKKGGVFVFKCQDIVHNHKLHATHIWVNNWISQFDFRLLDLFILTAKHRMPAPNRNGMQKHARIFHSYFMVFKKT